MNKYEIRLVGADLSRNKRDEVLTVNGKPVGKLSSLSIEIKRGGACFVRLEQATASSYSDATGRTLEYAVLHFLNGAVIEYSPGMSVLYADGTPIHVPEDGS